jgi:hypothetical protein
MYTLTVFSLLATGPGPKPTEIQRVHLKKKLALAQSQRSYNAYILKMRRFFIIGDTFLRELFDGPADFFFLGVRPNFKEMVALQISCL